MKVRSLQFGKALSAVLFVLLLSAVGMKKMYAYDFSAVCSTGQTLYYNITDATNHYVELTYPGTNIYYNWSGFTKPTGNIVLPESVQHNGVTYMVTSINSGTFRYCNGLTGDLVIPNSVTIIGDDTFNRCSGFTGTLTIGNSVTAIGQNAFYNCSGFTGSLTIPNSVTYLGAGAFEGCRGFTGTLTIGNSMTTIGNTAFKGCSGFSSLTIPNSVTTIGESAFSNLNGLTNVYYTGDIGQWCNISFGNEYSNPLGYAHNLYVNNALVTNLVIPDNVTEIKAYAFYKATCLTSLSIGNSVTLIGDVAFSGCSGLSGSLTIPNSVTEIGYGAFQSCSNLTGSLTIPNSVTLIGDVAFYGCRGLNGSLTISNSLTEIGSSVFSSCSGLTGSLTIPNSVTTIGNQAFYGCTSLTGSLIIPNSVTSIGGGAFQNCSGFTGSLILPNSVSTIGYYAFSGCTGLTGNLVIPDSITEIAEGAFQYCNGFTGSLTIPNSVTTIGYQAFYICTGFTGDLIIPNSVTNLGYGAFTSCSGFTGSLTIGNSVTEIGEYVFNGCSGFTGSLTIPNSVTTIGSNAFSGCSGFTDDLIIGNSVTTIGENAFEGCSGFTGSLTISSSVNEINGFAFYNCDGFSEIYLRNNTPPLLGEYAFSYYSISSIPVYVPCGTQNLYSNAEGWSQFTNYQEMGYITVMANPESLGYTYIDQYGTCESPQSAVYACPNYSEFTYSSYEFINWTVDGVEVSTNPYYTFELTEDITLVANFGPGSSHVFVGGNTNLWSEVENWMPQELPTATSSIEILANVEVDGEASAANVSIANGMMMTILPEGVLTVTESLNTLWGDYSIVIEDGGQLYHPNEGIITTVKKAITPYTPGTKNGWHLITNPMYYSTYIYDMETLIDNEYDLYYYDEPTYYWMNQKDIDNNFYYLQNGKGYLYANSENVTLEFVGEPRIGTASVNVPLSYTTDHTLEGFNLMGNPFVHNITSYASENVANGCFVMNPTKDNLIVSEISETNPLKPTEGFFVKATAEGASITFNPQRGKANAQQGTISVELTENGKLIDRLIVKREGEPLEKLSLNNSRTKLFAQGEHQELAIVPCKGNEQPVCFKAAKDGTYTIHVNVDGMEFNYLHLIDNLTGIDVDLLAKPDYTFTAKTTDYASRFKLVFSTNAKNASNNNK